MPAIKQMPTVLLLMLLCLVVACRKDTLHFRTVEQVSVAGDVPWNTAVFLPGGIGIVGGGSRFEPARVLRSTDYGASWVERPMPADSKGLTGHSVAPDGTLYFCSLGLNICASADAMGTYNYARVPGPYEFVSAVSFGQAERGFVSLNIKTDSGAIVSFDNKLQLLGVQAFKNALHDLLMLDAKRGLAVGSGTVLRTNDGGKSWIRQAAIGDNFNSISALDSNRIFISGLSGYIMKSIDGGRTWKRRRNGGDITLPNYQLWDLLMVTEQKGYAVGEKGLVIYTDDGGTHWSEYDRFTSNNLRFVTLCPDGKLLVGGEQGALFRLGN